MDEVNRDHTSVASLKQPAAPGEPTLVVLSGELDISNVDAARAVVDEALSAGPDRLAFDLSGLTFMDSSGIAVLVHAANLIDDIELRQPSDIVRRIIEITGLSDTFTINS